MRQIAFRIGYLTAQTANQLLSMTERPAGVPMISHLSDSSPRSQSSSEEHLQHLQNTLQHTIRTLEQLRDSNITETIEYLQLALAITQLKNFKEFFEENRGADNLDDLLASIIKGLRSQGIHTEIPKVLTCLQTAALVGDKVAQHYQTLSLPLGKKTESSPTTLVQLDRDEEDTVPVVKKRKTDHREEVTLRDLETKPLSHKKEEELFPTADSPDIMPPLFTTEFHPSYEEESSGYSSLSPHSTGST